MTGAVEHPRPRPERLGTEECRLGSHDHSVALAKRAHDRAQPVLRDGNASCRRGLAAHMEEDGRAIAWDRVREVVVDDDRLTVRATQHRGGQVLVRRTARARIVRVVVALSWSGSPAVAVLAQGTV